MGRHDRHDGGDARRRSGRAADRGHAAFGSCYGSTERGKAVRLANPEILHSSIELREHEEASPNLPGVSATVKRPRAVTVRFLNEEGTVDRRDFVGIDATSVQHQIDHLNGKMYFDRLSKVKRDMLLRKARKQT